MLHCKCGYTCGTRAAFERHLLRFDADASAHGLGSPPVPSLPTTRDKEAVEIKAVSKKPERADARDTASTAGLGRMIHPGGATTAPAKSLAEELQSIQAETSPKQSRIVAKSSSRDMGSGNATVKLVLVRHAKSGNKDREKGQAASADPDPSDLGFVQADALAQRLKMDYGRRNDRIVIGTSPMRRCLLTILPTVQQMGTQLEDCLCHGGLYEFAGAGHKFAGSHWADIKHEFPHFRPVQFGDTGHWDYRGDSHEESEPEFIERVKRLVDWIDYTAEEMRSTGSRVGRKILLLCVHQTLADLITRLYIDGSHDGWMYGEIKYKIQNAGLTEIHLDSDGQAAFGLRNAGSHLLGVKKDGSIGPRRYVTSPAASLRATLKERFRAFDKNGDNQLSFEEMAALLRRGDPSLSDENLKLVFNGCDRNSNDLVDFDEFTAFIFSSTENHNMVEQL
mmetsp:Transcript_37575/g.86827  ORF Transcript_37575/g.86827 Transcript_37575/m.86827 type:complete len:450 (-) Transcript_37575:128-1477(-)